MKTNIPFEPMYDSPNHDRRERRESFSDPPSYNEAIGIGDYRQEAIAPAEGVLPDRSMPRSPQFFFIQNRALPLGPRTTFITCPFCHVQQQTRIEAHPTQKTHQMAGLLCAFGCWCCCCLPFFINSCMDIHHYCGYCNKFVGIYNNGNN